MQKENFLSMKTKSCLSGAGDADAVIEEAFEKAIEECEYAIW